MSRMSENYPDDWRTLRKEVFERDEHTCRNCGADVSEDTDTVPHCHHIVPISCGGTHKKTNLATLCEICHLETHKEMRRYRSGSDVRAEKEFSGDYLPKTPGIGDAAIATDGGADTVDECAIDWGKIKAKWEFPLPQRIKWRLFGVPEERQAFGNGYWMYTDE